LIFLFTEPLPRDSLEAWLVEIYAEIYAENCGSCLADLELFLKNPSCVLLLEV
jgi:hypothetical protein